MPTLWQTAAARAENLKTATPFAHRYSNIARQRAKAFDVATICACVSTNGCQGHSEGQAEVTDC
jgi:hypothetical protein